MRPLPCLKDSTNSFIPGMMQIRAMNSWSPKYWTSVPQPSSFIFCVILKCDDRFMSLLIHKRSNHSQEESIKFSLFFGGFPILFLNLWPLPPRFHILKVRQNVSKCRALPEFVLFHTFFWLSTKVVRSQANCLAGWSRSFTAANRNMSHFLVGSSHNSNSLFRTLYLRWGSEQTCLCYLP